MKKYSGTVKNINDTKWNGTTLWSFQLEGQNIWFRTGTTKPPIENGQEITFEANEANKQVDLASVTSSSTTESPPTTSTSSSTAAPTQGGSSTREDYWQNRERLDSIRSARADAARVVCAALAHDHLPHAANVAKGKRLDLLVGYIEELTQEFIEYESGSTGKAE